MPLVSIKSVANLFEEKIEREREREREKTDRIMQTSTDCLCGNTMRCI